jgi:uncharacterized membrane protein (UPF0127 family)
VHPGGAGRDRGVDGHVSEQDADTPRRLRGLPSAELAGGHRVPVATSISSRLLGLALLDRRQAGRGLLIPRCRAVHTFGMRFPLELRFLDDAGKPLSIRPSVPPRRLAFKRGARAVLELPGGEQP